MKYTEFNQIEYVFKNHRVYWSPDVYIHGIFINNYIIE